MQKNIIRTERLILRPWQANDYVEFAKLTADPRVMEFFPSILTREESDQFAERFAAHINEHGWGLWAAEIPEIAPFIGFIGLNRLTFDAHFTPAVEIGWRLAHDFWGKGYATEGARAALDYGFNILNLNEIVSLTAVDNKRSRKVMEKLGMTYDPADDFDHPRVAESSPLRRHVLYRSKKSIC